LPPGPPNPLRVRRRRRQIAGVTVLLAVAVLVVLAIFPIRPVEVTAQRVASYSVPVAESTGGSEPIAFDFFSWCDGMTIPTPWVGNQTIWVTWETTDGSKVLDATIVNQSAYPTLDRVYNATNVSQGGFAMTSTAAIHDLCTSDFVFGASAASNVTIRLEVGVVYVQTTKVPYL